MGRRLGGKNADPGPVNPDPASGTMGTGQDSPSVDDLLAAAGVGGEKPAPGSDGSGTGGDAGAGPASVRPRKAREPKALDDPLKKQLEQLFESEMWGEVGSVWFELRAVVTGFENFRLTQDQKRKIGVPLAMLLRGRLSPDQAAIVLLALNVIMLIVQKEAEWAIEKKKRKGPAKVEPEVKP